MVFFLECNLINMDENVPHRVFKCTPVGEQLSLSPRNHIYRQFTTENNKCNVWCNVITAWIMFKLCSILLNETFICHTGVASVLRGWESTASGLVSSYI